VSLEFLEFRHYAFLCNVEMGDHLSPVMEGFSNPTMTSVFREMLKMSNSQTSTGQNVEFLKNIVEEQKRSADALMESAKKIGPVSQTIKASDDAYTAAFETDVVAPMPTMSGTLQGFTIFFFTVSFISLSIVLSVSVNLMSGNTSYAVYTFIFCIVSFLVISSLIARLG